MGYTHYWKHQGFTPAQWNKLVTFTRLAIKKLQIPIVNGNGDEGSSPAFDGVKIRFNGEGEDSHETFNLTRAAQDFEFCKTAMKPYDDVVVAVMREAMKLNPNFKPTSDGGWAVFHTESD
jgi:hypothetical protein